MAVVRYQSPDEAAFLVFDKARFRVEHGIFYLRSEPLRRHIEAILAAQSDWNLAVMKLEEENRRLRACLDWLETLTEDPDETHVADFVHEPALDVVANALIARQQYDRADCPACLATYPVGSIPVIPWKFEEHGVTIRGQRTTCPLGHTIHVLTEAIDGLDLESDED